MSDTVIRVENLGKKYLIGHQERLPYRTLRESMVRGAKNLSRNLLNPFGKKVSHPAYEEFWALKDVSFEIKQGDVVGIIGRNGAGKSTLLKILSRITEPSIGRIFIKGRVASLLEVGTGFHPELTGRENIYLNGAILGMSKAEIKQKFDEIVAFAEVEKFLDTPVKRYSSGMYVRLAFAVAAHLEPEILVVDEVLAVGDAAFQKKCLGKMGDVATKEGRTVLFVSHNMAAVEKLCRRGIVLHQGKLQYVGNQTDSISKYLTNFSASVISLKERTDRQGSGEIRVVAIEIRDEEDNILDTAASGQNINIYFYFELKPGNQLKKTVASLMVKTEWDAPVFIQHSRLTQSDFGVINRSGLFICKIKRLPLPPANYRIAYSIMPNNGMEATYYDYVEDAVNLTVVDGDFYGYGEVPPISHGVCLVDSIWEIKLN
ncbi:ABC transporter ATP-binding protein [Aerosakkonema funiforme]|nr:ABC transporter ATP-binding protein [Aerosakkonema funiforme]